MPERRLPPGGENKFQRIKALCAAAEEKGQTLYKLSIGQPRGPALLSARMAASQAVLSADEPMHGYQDNDSPGVPDFARRFVAAHVPGVDLSNMSFLPILGIKSMLGLIPQACGGIGHGRIIVGTTTDPGYPTPADQCRYQGQEHYALPTNVVSRFRFLPRDIETGTNLLIVNYPHNPSGQIATEEWWIGICTYCANHGIRLFNDGAYAMLAYDSHARTLAEVAVKFPDLSWAEAFSASKAIANGTGWRVGAMVGSPDFIADIAEIKGNTDSGLFAPAAAGVIAALEKDMAGIEDCRRVYHERIGVLIAMLRDGSGMRLAVTPRAGFFTLWIAPVMAFGVKVNANAERFNGLMIEHTGIVGVPFETYIRYAVTSPIENPEWQEAIRAGFEAADVSY